MTDAELERLADLVADRLYDRLSGVVAPPTAEGGLLTVAQVAARLGVARDYVYRNADHLGVVRIGNGTRPRLRFDPAAVDSAGQPNRRGSEQPNGSSKGKPGRKRRRPQRRLPGPLPATGGRRA